MPIRWSPSKRPRGSLTQCHPRTSSSIASPAADIAVAMRMAAISPRPTSLVAYLLALERTPTMILQRLLHDMAHPRPDGCLRRSHRLVGDADGAGPEAAGDPRGRCEAAPRLSWDCDCAFVPGKLVSVPPVEANVALGGPRRKHD